MLSVATVKRAGYYLGLSSSEYYLKGGERPGEWLLVTGGGCRADGQVDKASLENLLAGRTRDGSKQLVRPNARRQLGWDFTFSAPKAVSVLYALAPRLVRELILEAHRNAVAAAASYLAREAFWARRGKGGGQHEHVAALMTAEFVHVTSRALDPQLHSHVLVANVARRLDGSYGAVVSRDAYRHKMAAGAVYRVELAHRLQQTLGVIIRRVGDNFTLLGVPARVCRHFSKRSQEIRRLAREVGVKHPRYLEALAKATAGTKTRLSHSELHDRWEKQARRLGFTRAILERLLNLYRPSPSPERHKQVAANAAAAAIEKLEAKHSYFTERQLTVAAAPKIVGRGGGEELLREAVGVACGRLVRLETPGLKHGYYTTLGLYNTEKRLIRLAESYGRSQARAQVPFGKLLKTLDADATHAKWSAEQRVERLGVEAAVRYLASGESIRILTGQQGSGKTTALRLTKKAFEANGQDVIGAAPTAAATGELRRQLGDDCLTVAALLDAAAPSRDRRLRHAARQAWRMVRGKSTKRRGQAKLDAERKPMFFYKQLRRLLRGKLPRYAGQLKVTADTVLLIDEAQKLSTQDAHDLIKLAEKTGCTLRLTVTLDSPTGGGPGGAVEHLCERLGTHQVQLRAPERAIWRQTAHKALRNGDAETFLQKYRHTKSLVEKPTLRMLRSAVIAAWSKDPNGLADKLIIAPDAAEASKLNRLAQKHRVKQLRVLPMGGLKLNNGDRVRPGDRIRLGQTDRHLGVNAGDFGTVLSVTRMAKKVWRRRVLVKIEGQKRFGLLPRIVSLDTKYYRSLSLGYALTPDQVQSRVSSVFVVADREQTTPESLLHQLTRSEKKAKLFTVDTPLDKEIEPLRDALQRKRTKKMAHQLESELSQGGGFGMAR